VRRAKLYARNCAKPAPGRDACVAQQASGVGKTLGSFDFDAVPMVSKAQVMALTAGDSWLEKGANLLLFGPPGGGKSHLSQPPAVTHGPGKACCFQRPGFG
jgi:hypothetical protein